jgi:hypothetical protein
MYNFSFSWNVLIRLKIIFIFITLFLKFMKTYTAETTHFYTTIIRINAVMMEVCFCRVLSLLLNYLSAVINNSYYSMIAQEIISRDRTSKRLINRQKGR